jgi:hypothetical protein
LKEWLEMVIAPTLPEHPTESERREVEKIAALSRYFGGTPKVVSVESLGGAVPLPHVGGAVPRSRDRGTSAAIIARMRKRGC